MWKGPEYPGDFPSLGYLGSDWIEAHCAIPDGEQAGDPFVLTDEQLTFFVHHYRLRLSAMVGQRAPAFVYRRSQLVRPQKWGKGPLEAAQICVEGVGPALFAGWAQGGETWDCRDHGCDCGWIYEYEPGEPMGRPWPTPLIQVTATSEDQTDNVYDALRPMIQRGPLAAVIPKTGEVFTRLPRGGRIDTVTANAQSRLGQRVTFVVQDETSIWFKSNGMIKVAQTQRRGLAGMGGRSVETTNGWDRAEGSVAQLTAESKRPDIYHDHRQAPAGLRYTVKSERAKIHRVVYGDSYWVDLDAIEAEAAELLETDPAQAERFFGNRDRAGSDAAFNPDRWAELERPDYMPDRRAKIVVGVDGARYDDALALVATEIATGFQWPIGIWERPEATDDDYEHPTGEVDAAMVDAFATYKVLRVYIDPQYIDHLVDLWAGRWGSKVIFKWVTSRPRQIAFALRSYANAMKSGELGHNGDPVFAAHIANAKRRTLNVFDDEHRPMWGISKDAPKSARKIDGAMAGTLSWEARGDAIAAGANKPRKARAAFV